MDLEVKSSCVLLINEDFSGEGGSEPSSDWGDNGSYWLFVPRAKGLEGVSDEEWQCVLKYSFIVDGD